MSEVRPEHPALRDRTSGRLFLLVAAVGALLFVLGVIEGRREPPVPAGLTAPDVALPMLDGSTARLSDHRGKVVILDFWATWCPPCVESLPALDQLAKEKGAQGLVALAVNRDDPEDQDVVVREFLSAHGLSSIAPVLDQGVLADTFRVSALPTLVVIRRDGTVATSKLGGSTLPELRALVEPLLSAQADAELAGADGEVCLLAQRGEETSCTSSAASRASSPSSRAAP